ncbi:MAG: 50S ribosomal protein L4 [Candidatus Yanofskybacteria bacterium GW2011_GWA2_41_22]|uniref:Large ribosomal subunit protein uL4 n=4 Tax=Parcubacteria group TaxID=1794811 RepID=A0A0G0VL14_9BACT|nr:MAG: 50S ribosomal protein L4 [Candidatus Yanofskybacteria bacterium GW2011_GWA2_41_22]KKS25718.1 MAG: 50S ribosomal protein L4 [Candidatus Jorgensenbacteria bacterium GW2011_GWF2_41_8]KKS27561.1 MAG: 50S ribosomal protein L4 [Candidatus Yanofskybacteria bacterium GW2011_GWC2_41_9]
MARWQDSKMQFPLYNQNAEEISKIDLPDSIFGLKLNADLLHQVVTSLISNKRQVIAHAKGRSEVRGGGKKPWRQKGTGRARHGSIRSPIWKGGGVTFGPTKERNFKKKINKKMARKALLMAISSKAKNRQLLVLDEIKLNQAKTKEMALILKNFSKLFEESKNKPSVLMITPSLDSVIKRAAENLPSLNTVEARNINPLLILSSKYLLLMKDAVDILKKK